MKSKKIIVGLLIFVILAIQISVIQFGSKVYASDSVNNGKYYYDQLTDVAKVIYDGIYKMYTEGILKTGDGSYDLASDNSISQDTLTNHANGSNTLNVAMDAARYAFYVDHPEVFYVNFPKLSLRVTKDANDMYHAKLGSGSYKNYYNDGFNNADEVENAINEFNTEVKKIVDEVNGLENASQVEKIKHAHNILINKTEYRLETDCTPGNEVHISTPYGAIVKEQAVCEGYARAFKSILDKLGMTCIIVQGLHQSEGSAAVAHMWNYVQIDKETNSRAIEKVWYAVDATMDDPFLRSVDLNPDIEKEPGWDIEDGFENTRYCLTGVETMVKEHTPLETVEAAGNNVFRYPELEMDDYGIDTVVNNNGLLVKFKQEGTETEEYKAGDFYISYNGMGYKEAAKGGHYILMKSHSYLPGDEKWVESKWAYLDPDPYAGGVQDKGDHIYLILPSTEYVEFAVTTKPRLIIPGGGSSAEELEQQLAYTGDETDFVAKTQKLHNPNGTYIGKPYIKKQTPAPTATLSVGTEYDVDVIYTDKLVFKEGVTEVGYRIESSTPTGAENTKITNFSFDGNNRITFHIKFSNMYADDDANYSIYLTGLVGYNSRKEPMKISYGAINQIACAYSMNKAKSWNVFARPTLMENEDLSMNGWVTKDGDDVADKLKSRIALVTTKPTQTEENDMKEQIEDKLPNQVLSSETYNISLNVCRKYVVKTGHKLRLSVGFPAGYGPDDAGVTFKAYHFAEDGTVEEIPCVITPYGLVITCDSFSPYAIVAADNKGNIDSTKYAIVTASEGGVINGADRENGNIFGLKEGETREITIVPDEGYRIETLTVGNRDVLATRGARTGEMNVTVSYDDIKEGNGLVNATFVADTVADQESAAGLSLVVPQAKEAEVTMPESTKLGTINKEITITPNVVEKEGVIYSYQWYKDGEALNGKTEKVLKFVPTSSEETGEYTVKVTTLVGTSTAEKMSPACNVTVRSFDVGIANANSSVNLKKLHAGDEFELNINIDKIDNVTAGFITMLGKLEYDTSILERIDVTGQNGWEIDNNYFNEGNFKFIIDNNQTITGPGTIFKLKFRVKDNVNENKTSAIKVKGISASGANGDVNANDAETQIGIEMLAESITSKVYKVDNTAKEISKVVANTTIADFKKNVVATRALVFKDSSGKVITDETTKVGTGMTVEAGSLKFTIIVTGDVNGNGEVDIDDLGFVKMHLIEKTSVPGIPLTGIKFKAGDINMDGDITIDDVANIKVTLINQ